jgi:two-component system, LytTR family, sensor kinase
MISTETSNRLNLYFYITAWLIICFVQAVVLHYFYSLSGFLAFYDSAIFNGTFALLGISIWYIVRYTNFSKSTILSFILNHLFSMLFLIGIWLVISFFISYSLINNKEYETFLSHSTAWRAIIGFFFYALISLIYYVIIFYTNIQNKTKAEAELKALIKEAELNSLKNQINPHFLFNSLNSISSLTITNPEKAREMLVKLSELMRYSLKTNHNDQSTLKVEIENIEKYLALEKIRFGEKLVYEKDIDENCSAMLIPNMLLQPLFENAIKHGIYESTESVTIKVKCRAINNLLQIIIENNFDPDGKSHKGEGIGIANIKKRLAIIYKIPNLLNIEKRSNLFIAKLLIPQK